MLDGCGTDGGVMQGRLVGASVTVVVSSTVVGGAVGPGSGTVTVGPGGPGGPGAPGSPAGPGGPGTPPAVVVGPPAPVVPVVAPVVAAELGTIVGAVNVVGIHPSVLGPCEATTADTPTSSSAAGIHR